MTDNHNMIHITSLVMTLHILVQLSNGDQQINRLPVELTTTISQVDEKNTVVDTLAATRLIQKRSICDLKSNEKSSTEPMAKMAMTKIFIYIAL